MRTRNFISGEWLGKKNTVRRIPAIAFVFILMLLYIMNIYSIQKLHNDISKAERRILSWNVTAETTRANLITLTKESTMVEMVNNKEIGLIETETPPEIITVEGEKSKERSRW